MFKTKTFTKCMVPTFSITFVGNVPKYDLVPNFAAVMRLFTFDHSNVSAYK